MGEDVTVSGKTYVSSKRASELSAYTQDYIGQLARAGFIDAQRIGGLWHVSMDSLLQYKENAEKQKPEPPRITPAQEPDTLVFFDGKEFISAGHAATITGYAQDYVGQLARSGKVFSQQVGNRWYVERESILNHKKEKDALLAAVQSESVGLHYSQPESSAHTSSTYDETPEPHFKYVSEEGDLIPSVLNTKTAEDPSETIGEAHAPEIAHPIPIRIFKSVRGLSDSIDLRRGSVVDYSRDFPAITNAPRFFIITAASLTIVIVASIGFATFYKESLYAFSQNNLKNDGQALVAGVAKATDEVTAYLEDWFVPEITYTRIK